MKIVTVCLPTLVLAGVTLLLATQAPTSAIAGDAPVRDVEKSRLQHQEKAIADRLEELTAGGHHVLPRGGL